MPSFLRLIKFSLSQAVQDDYYFQMFYDDLPIWGFIGKIEKLIGTTDTELRYFLFTHVHFEIAFHNDRVIEINVSTDPTQTVDISDDQISDGSFVPVEFTYSVKWKSTGVPFERRMDKYSRHGFLPHHLEVGCFNCCRTVSWQLKLSAACLACADPLVLDHQLLHHSASPHWLSRYHSHARAEKRLC